MTNYIQHIVEDFDFNSVLGEGMYDNIVYNYIIDKSSELTDTKLKIMDVDPNLGIALTPVTSTDCVLLQGEVMYNGTVELCNKTLQDFIIKHKIYYIENSIFVFKNSEKGGFDDIHIPDFVDCIGPQAFANCSIKDLYLGEYTTSLGSFAFSDSTIKNLHLNNAINPLFIHTYAFVDMKGPLENIYYKNPSIKQSFKDRKVKTLFIEKLKPEPKD